MGAAVIGRAWMTGGADRDAAMAMPEDGFIRS